MRTSRKNIGSSIKTPLAGLATVALSIVCLLVMLWVLIIFVRLVTG